MENYIVEYIEDGRLYLVLGETKFKDPSTRKWVKAIYYKPLYGDISLSYVREITDFNEKFIKVNLDDKNLLRIIRNPEINNN